MWLGVRSMVFVAMMVAAVSAGVVVHKVPSNRLSASDSIGIRRGALEVQEVEIFAESSSDSTTEVTGSTTASTTTTDTATTVVDTTTAVETTSSVPTTTTVPSTGTTAGSSTATTFETTASTEGSTTPADKDPDDQDAALTEYNQKEEVLRQLIVEAQEADWAEAVNDTPENLNASAVAHEKFYTAYADFWNSVINFYNWEQFNDTELVRRFSLLAKPGTSALSPEEQSQLNGDIATMNALSLKKVCPFDNQECEDEDAMSLDQVEVLMATVRDADTLEYYWTTWRDIAGAPAKPSFVDLVELENIAATDPDNGFADASEMWLQPYIAPDYTTTNFTEDIDELWNGLSGFYQKLHGYVRYKLRDSEAYWNIMAEDSPIPAHLLGNMWAQDWQNIYDIVAPFPEVEILDITDVLNNSDITVDQMFKIAEDFFVETGLYNLTQQFWENSYPEQEPGLTSVCHASAWDFFSITSGGAQTTGDFRIKMCTKKNQEDFIVLHHEMGHTQYQMAYSERVNTTEHEPTPLVFRDGANPGFHEAIGDTIALSVSTQSHLQQLANYISGTETKFQTRADTNTTYQMSINQQMKIALDKIAFLPYAYILDKFRWDVFQGLVPVEEYNYHWWWLRLDVQGLKPPNLREKDLDFDPGCKFHVANNVPYIRYFVAYILQFQFQEKLCAIKDEVEGNTTELFECDIYGVIEAGEYLKDMLVKGNSQPWTQTLSEFLDSDIGMSSESIKLYFKDLEDWLDEQQQEHGYQLDWTRDLDNYFVQHVPATVPIVVGIVLAVMIIIVVVAYFVGKKRQDTKASAKKDNSSEVDVPAGLANEGFEMGEAKKKASVSSSSSSASSTKSNENKTKK